MTTEHTAPSDHFEADLGPVAAVTDRGRRHPVNQDAFAVQAHAGRAVWAVCDGVSSSSRPELAAATAARAVIASLSALLAATEWPDTEAVVVAVETAAAAAEQAVVALAGPHDPTSATTIVLGATGPGVTVVGNIGDSRAYWIDGNGGPHEVLTVDDSWAQQAISEGATPAEAYASPRAHVITRCLRTDATEPTPPNLTVVEVGGPGRIVVCSDGLWNYLETAADIAVAVGDATDPSPLGISRHLVEVALNAGGVDNVTVAVIPTGPGGVA
jgi:serine/threonine protein phosphatase PrpC